jgi:zinc transport system substrate-binding protein
MKKVGLIASVLIGVILLTLAILLPGCSGGEASSNLKVEVADIIPPAQCPGHFDVKPSDIQMLADANLFLMHGWQGEQFSQQLIQSANNPDLESIPLNIAGNWMTPAVQAQAVGNITSILSEIDPQNAGYYQSNADLELSNITAKANELETMLAAGNLSQINVICDIQIVDLVQWAGFNVVTTYPSPDAITPKLLQGLIDQGKQAGVVLIIGNLQSGSSDMTATLADGIGAAQVTLSNFPGGFNNTDTWEKAIDQDVNLMLQAAATCRGNSS